MNREELAGKSREELVVIAATLNIKPHHKALPETIINQIMQQPVAFVADAMKHPAERAAPPPAKINTPDEVRDAIKNSVKDGFEARFLDDDQTWHFRCKGAEDSGHMSTPLRTIVQKAQIVSRGKVSLKGFKDGNEIVMWG